MPGRADPQRTRRRDRATFALTQLAFWLLAATDGHAKNYSIRPGRGGRFHLAPLYDVLSAWPIIGRGPNQVAYQRAKFAMAVRGRNAHYSLGEFEARNWQALAASCGLGVWEQMTALVARVDDALRVLESRLPDGFPPNLWSRISDGCR